MYVPVHPLAMSLIAESDGEAAGLVTTAVAIYDFCTHRVNVQPDQRVSSVTHVKGVTSRRQGPRPCPAPA
ncbi:hypothetical protein Hesp01_00320 [Herbidospora sp. NBRC 101105]|nr:hypothetical protein Hesp01_00320 [Herbidospora sp. NBRC 101105]